jgi:very-long-chain (3R)-3-hydroxyacyl-CoA dehydratase
MASAKSQYLVAYNTTFALLWLALLIRILALSPFYKYDKTYAVVGDYAKWIQTAALLDVLHAAIG